MPFGHFGDRSGRSGARTRFHTQGRMTLTPRCHLMLACVSVTLLARVSASADEPKRAVTDEKAAAVQAFARSVADVGAVC